MQEIHNNCFVPKKCNMTMCQAKIGKNGIKKRADIFSFLFEQAKKKK